MVESGLLPFSLYFVTFFHSFYLRAKFIEVWIIVKGSKKKKTFEEQSSLRPGEDLLCLEQAFGGAQSRKDPPLTCDEQKFSWHFNFGLSVPPRVFLAFKKKKKMFHPTSQHMKNLFLSNLKTLLSFFFLEVTFCQCWMRSSLVNFFSCHRFQLGRWFVSLE